jgi:hypothetical protein
VCNDLILFPQTKVRLSLPLLLLLLCRLAEANLQGIIRDILGIYETEGRRAVAEAVSAGEREIRAECSGAAEFERQRSTCHIHDTPDHAVRVQRMLPVARRRHSPGS